MLTLKFYRSAEDTDPEIRGPFQSVEEEDGQLFGTEPDGNRVLIATLAYSWLWELAGETMGRLFNKELTQQVAS